MFSVPAPKLGCRKHTTRWIKIISNHKPQNERWKYQRSCFSVEIRYLHIAAFKWSLGVNYNLLQSLSKILDFINWLKCSFLTLYQNLKLLWRNVMFSGQRLKLKKIFWKNVSSHSFKNVYNKRLNIKYRILKLSQYYSFKTIVFQKYIRSLKECLNFVF